MTTYDVLIIGAGASGLMASNELLGAGHSVCILEAAPTAGGRIRTIKIQEFGVIETGAEFIHGKLPLTLKLLKKAGIDYTPITGKFISVRQGEWLEEEAHDEHWKEFLDKLSDLKDDMTISQFLDLHFPSPKYDSLREAVRHFAEGFDLADINDASMLSVREEWMHEQDTQFRIPGGYCQLVDWLKNAILEKKGMLVFDCRVTNIRHERDNVIVTTANNQQFEARRAIVTVSAGIMQSGEITFSPSIPIQEKAFSEIGFGTVIKFCLLFRTAFWMSRDEELGFLLSDEDIPTWWTQFPQDSNLLTGWLGGPTAIKRSSESQESLLDSALKSLGSIFNMPPDELRRELVHHTIACWHNDPHVKGGYSYQTVYSEGAKKVLAQPVDDTLFFAGEAIYDGDSQGTVEAALQSGQIAAKKIIASLKKMKEAK